MSTRKTKDIFGETIDAYDYHGLKVHPVVSLFPMLSETDMDALVLDIKQNGLTDPIVLDHTGMVIIDGRNRYQACVRATVDPRYRRLNRIFSEEDIIKLILSSNIRRRHLDLAQRTMIGLGAEPYLEAAVKLG